MPTNDVTVSLPTVPPHLVEIDAVRLQAKKTINAGATDAHGTEVRHLSAAPGNPNGSMIVVRVVT